MKNYIILLLLFSLFCFLKINKNNKSSFYDQIPNQSYPVSTQVTDLPYHLRYNLKYTKNNVDVYARDVLGYSPCQNVNKSDSLLVLDNC